MITSVVNDYTPHSRCISNLIPLSVTTEKLNVNVVNDTQSGAQQTERQNSQQVLVNGNKDETNISSIRVCVCACRSYSPTENFKNVKTRKKRSENQTLKRVFLNLAKICIPHIHLSQCITQEIRGSQSRWTR